jgi:uncharacterized protein YcsI (UPF0317 family)
MAPARTTDVPATGAEARSRSRTNTWDAPTCGIAPGYLQANLIVLPSRLAKDFVLLCTRNPVPCPLLATSSRPGDFSNFISYIPGVPNAQIAKDFDVRKDAPRYNVYRDGSLTESAIVDVDKYWSDDHVACLIGCSYSFENALHNANLTPPHVLHGRNIPMYRTTLPLLPAGVFQSSTLVVSMRMYKAADVEVVRDITRPYVTTHGEPIAWGWNGMRDLGIADINRPDWGDVPVNGDGESVVQDQAALVPIFWGCGVTPQEAVMRAKIPGIAIGHAPGYMVVLDIKEDDVLRRSN